MDNINSYPALVDTIWTIVQGTAEDRERIDFTFSEPDIVKSLGIPYSWDSSACVYGVATAINDLVDLGYCKGRGTYNGHRWMHISPSPDCPVVLPSASLLASPIAKLPPLRERVLRYIHEQTLRHEDGITFYDHGGCFPLQDVVPVFLPDTNETNAHLATGQIAEAMTNLKERGYVKGVITFGAFNLWITLKGACWFLVAQPLLQISERAAQLKAYPEATEVAKLLRNAHSEAESKAAQTMYVAVEKLENAVGGEKKLVEMLGQPKAYVGDLKQSLQSHRHAATHAQTKLDHQECLTRTTELIERYIAERERTNISSK